MCRINKTLIVLSLIIGLFNITCNAQGFPPRRGPFEGNRPDGGMGREAIRNGDREGKVQLPMPPVTTTSSFDRALMDVKKDSPFGFFDPNMMRFQHLSFYRDFASVMNDMEAYWASFGATFSFGWALIQKKNPDGSYKESYWERHDRLIKSAQAHNIHIIGIIVASEPITGEQKGRIMPSLPKDLEGYKRFVKEVVERYDGDGKEDMPGLEYPVKYWLIEDEPMWRMYFNGTGSDYAVVLDAAYEAVKSADPGANVICAMLREVGNKASSQPRAFMEDFFKKLAESGNKRPYDIIDQHWIGGEDIYRQYSFYKEIIEDIDSTARKHGFTSVPFFALEIAGPHNATEEIQAADLLRRYAILLSFGVKKILWSGVRAAPEMGLNREQMDNYFGRVTLIKGDGEKKPAYWTYKLMVKMLDGSDWDKTEFLQAEDGVYVFKFIKNGMPVWVVCNNNGNESKIKIDAGDDIKTAQVIKAVPEEKYGKDSADYLNLFRHEELSVKEGILEINIGEIPLIITGK